MASGPVFLFCAPRLVFDGAERAESHFHVLLFMTHFRRYRGRWVPFSCFVLPNPFSTVPRAPTRVFMLYASGLVFDGIEGARSRFHVLRSRTHFWRYSGGRVPFSCFSLPDPLSAIPKAPDPIFMFCAPGPVFDGTEGVGSCFHVLRSRNRFRRYLERKVRRAHFWRYAGRQVQFSCFALTDQFLTVPKASGPDSFSAVTRASGP
jgi:hypothetical protein